MIGVEASLSPSLLARFTENRRFEAGELNHFVRLSRRWERFFEFEKRNNVWNGGDSSFILTDRPMSVRTINGYPIERAPKIRID